MREMANTFGSLLWGQAEELYDFLARMLGLLLHLLVLEQLLAVQRIDGQRLGDFQELFNGQLTLRPTQLDEHALRRVLAVLQPRIVVVLPVVQHLVAQEARGAVWLGSGAAPEKSRLGHLHGGGSERNE